MEPYPKAFVDMSLSIAPWALAHNPFDRRNKRPGLISQVPEAHAHVVEAARPMDLVALANKTYIGGRQIPGRFTHVAIYLGDEAELRAMGMWNDPAVRPHHDAIRNGVRFIEALRPVVRLAAPDLVLQVDSAALVRPALSLSQRRAAMRYALSTIGVPFDYWFDNSTPENLSCTELVTNAMPSLELRELVSYGRPAVMPDDLVARAIRGEGLQLVEHVRGTPEGGFVVEGIRPVMHDIAAFWGVPE